MTDYNFKIWLEKYAGWILIIVFSSLPIIRWMMINDISNLSFDWYTTFSTLGKLFGLAGFILYAVNLLLAVRHRWLENFFQGLNRVYIAHHITGGFALALIAFHPLFLALRSINLGAVETLGPAAKFLLPRSIDTTASYLEVQEAVAINSGLLALVGMVILLILTFFIILPYRLWLFTHRFLGVAFVFAGIHIVLISSDVSSDMVLRWYMIFWTIIGLLAYLYRTLFGNIFVRRAPYKVDKIVVNGTVVGIELSAMNKPINFNPGQFIFIRFRWREDDGILSEAHPFSVASGKDDATLRLYVKALGDYTSSLTKLKEGTIAEIEGSFGRFTAARYGTAGQVWIAGGIGITPFLSMAKSLTQTPQKVHLIHSVNERSELIEENMLAKVIPKRFKNFKYQPYIVNEQNSKLIDIEYINDAVGGLAGKEVFLCGPPPMMKALRQQMSDMGIPKRRIHSEDFTMS